MERETGNIVRAGLVGAIWGLSLGWLYQWLFDFMEGFYLPIWWFPLLGIAGALGIGQMVGMTSASSLVKREVRDSWTAILLAFGLALVTVVATHVFKFERAADAVTEAGTTLGFFQFLSWRIETGFGVAGPAGREWTSFNGLWVVLFWLIEASLVAATAVRAAFTEMSRAPEIDYYAELEPSTPSPGRMSLQS